MRTAPSELSPTSELKADDSAEVKPVELHCLERQSFGQQQYSALDTQVAFIKRHLISESTCKDSAACIPILNLTGLWSRPPLADKCKLGNSRFEIVG
jgi:hypothetical protein